MNGIEYSHHFSTKKSTLTTIFRSPHHSFAVPSGVTDRLTNSWSRRLSYYPRMALSIARVPAQLPNLRYLTVFDLDQSKIHPSIAQQVLSRRCRINRSQWQAWLLHIGRLVLPFNEIYRLHWPPLKRSKSLVQGNVHYWQLQSWR